MSTTAFSTSVEILPKPQKRKQLCKFTDKILFLFVHWFKSLWYSDLKNFDEFQVPDIFPYVLLEFFCDGGFSEHFPRLCPFLGPRRPTKPSEQPERGTKRRENLKVRIFWPWRIRELESKKKKSQMYFTMYLPIQWWTSFMSLSKTLINFPIRHFEHSRHHFTRITLHTTTYPFIPD